MSFDENLSFRNLFVEEMSGGGFIHLVVSFVSKDNKREESRKLCAMVINCNNNVSSIVSIEQIV